MQKKLSTLLGAILILCVSATTAGAGNLLPEGLEIEDTYQHGFGQSVGRILLVQGEVIVIHSDESVGYRVKKGLPVYKMDTLISLNRGRCLIRMNDRSRLTLASRTRLTINRSVYEEKKRERSSFFKMAIGKARFWVTKMTDAKRSEFRIKAATAVVGIRGSDFLIEIVEEKPRLSNHGLDRLTASLATDLALNGAGDETPAGLGVRITTITPETRLVATSTVNPELSVRLEGLQQVTFSPEALPTEVMDISPDEAGAIMNEMPVNPEDFQEVSIQPGVTGQPGKKNGGEAGKGKVEGGTGKDKQGEPSGEGKKDESAGEGKKGETAGGDKQGAPAGEAKGTPAATSGQAPAGQSGDQSSAGGGADQAVSGEGATSEPGAQAAGEEPAAEGAPAEPEPAAVSPEPEAAGVESFATVEPEIFVDDGELIEPEAIEEEVEMPAPIDPEVDDIVNQEQVESVQDTQQAIGQQIYEETVAGELPDFPSTP